MKVKKGKRQRERKKCDEQMSVEDSLVEIPESLLAISEREAATLDTGYLH